MCARMYIGLYVRTNIGIQKVKVQEDKETAKRNAKRVEHINRKVGEKKRDKMNQNR